MARTALVVSPVMPEFDRESGSRRLFDVIDLLQEQGWRVIFACRQEGHALYRRLLQQRGVQCHTRVQDPAALLKLINPQLVLCAFWYVAEEWLGHVRNECPAARLLIDSIDLHFLRNSRRLFQEAGANNSPPVLNADFAGELVRELNAYAAADGVLTVSEKEAELINDLLGNRRAYAAPDCEDFELSPVPLKHRRGILFLGNFKHPPNIGAIQYFLSEIFPHLPADLLSRHPVSIVGNAPTREVRSAVADLPFVRLVGWVPSVLPYLQQARVSVIPLLYGAGTKRKLIQSLMIGTPTVSTSIGVEGLELLSGEHVLVADTPRMFADQVEKLLIDDTLWRRLAAAGRSRIERSHSRRVSATALGTAIEAVLHASAARTSDSRHPVPLQAPTEYDRLIEQICETAARLLPDDTNVLVISKGDDQLLQLGQRRVSHFPQSASGAYAGHHPANATEAIRHLEMLRDRGAQFLLIPQTSAWWLDHYQQFAAHLARYYRLASAPTDQCYVFDLRKPPPCLDERDVHTTTSFAVSTLAVQ